MPNVPAAIRSSYEFCFSVGLKFLSFFFFLQEAAKRLSLPADMRLPSHRSRTNLSSPEGQLSRRSRRKSLVSPENMYD